MQHCILDGIIASNGNLSIQRVQPDTFRIATSVAQRFRSSAQDPPTIAPNMFAPLAWVSKYTETGKLK